MSFKYTTYLFIGLINYVDICTFIPKKVSCGIFNTAFFGSVIIINRFPQKGYNMVFSHHLH
ncbi:UNVERIFIED_CONTAM: hypothetical protein NCL1_56616 [Trichonephila clavipes]